MYIDRGRLKALRKQFPNGSRVELVQMDDVHAPPVGTKGTVQYVDDTGTIFVQWDTGSGLGVVYGKDSCIRVPNKKVVSDKDKRFYAMYSKLIEQGVPEIMLRQFESIRASGCSNMFDANTVASIAYKKGYGYLFNFITEDYYRYIRFVLVVKNNYYNQ